MILCQLWRYGSCFILFEPKNDQTIDVVGIRNSVHGVLQNLAAQHLTQQYG